MTSPNTFIYTKTPNANNFVVMPSKCYRLLNLNVYA
jgi:hypothetical protein